jgi:hypothetical protein
MRKFSYLLAIMFLINFQGFAYQIQNYVSQFSFYMERGFHRIRAPEFFLQGTPGHPELPVKFLHYIIPPNMKVDSIRVTINQTSYIHGSYYIYPAQPAVPMCSIPPWVPPDSTIYNSDSLYPNKFIEIINSGIFDGARIVTIAIYPLQYHPLSRRIFLVHNISFEFRFSSTTIPNRAQIRGINAQKTHDAVLTAAVENDWEIPLYYHPPMLVPDRATTSATYSC